MGSRSADLALAGVDEDGDLSTLQSSMEITGSLEDSVGGKHFCSSPREMDKKENFCTVPEDGGAAASFSKEAPLRMKRNRKAAGCSLRKSLAWNQAFLTEEGVLNPLELSTLTGSSTKSSGTSLSRVNLEMSPLLGHQESVDRPVLYNTEAYGSNKALGKPGTKIMKDEQQAHSALGKVLSTKGNTRSVPQLPTAYSQKRVANASAANPNSKLPKCMPMKSHASSLPVTSRTAISTLKSLKSGQSTGGVNIEQTRGVREFSSNKRSAAHDLGRHLAPHAEKDTSVSKMVPDPSALNLVHEMSMPSISLSSGLESSSHPQNAVHVFGAPPAPAHAKPSALRMPSPSLGFFRQGKRAPSYANHCQIKIQPTVSSVPPPRKPSSLKQTDELRSAPASTVRQPMRICAATKLGSGAQASLAANCLPLPSAAVSLEENVSVKLLDLKNRIPSVSPGCRTSDQEPINSSVNGIYSMQSQVEFLVKPAPEGREELSFEHSSTSKIDTKSSTEEIGLMIHSDEVTVSENNHDGHPPDGETNRSDFLLTKFSSQVCSPNKQHECEPNQLLDGDSGVLDVAKLPQAIDLGHETSPVLKGEDSAEDSDYISNLGFEITVRNTDHGTSVETESSFRLSTGHMSGEAISCSSLAQKTGMSMPTAAPRNTCLVSESSGTLSEESQSTLSEGTRAQNQQPPSDTNSMEEGAWMPSKSETKEKLSLNVIPLKYQLNAVPFSDEWVAALETYGEEVLKLKTGPVQNSPPDKTLPEPSPWSPVKRKAQDVGPFDCTKYCKN